jgi:hypothetical protein
VAGCGEGEEGAAMNTILYASAPLPPHGWPDPQEALKERLKRDAIEEQGRQSANVSPTSPVELLGIQAMKIHALNGLIVRLITCAENGYDTAELGDIVKDAKKAVGK